MAFNNGSKFLTLPSLVVVSKTTVVHIVTVNCKLYYSVELDTHSDLNSNNMEDELKRQQYNTQNNFIV